ncbi:MAG: vWA domain-containing protein, partial [Myxococcota bacterium]|nr:vWA domain-containing protein [Myxococcota bacterium]
MSSFLHKLFDPEGEFNRAEVIWKGEWSGLSLCLVLLLAVITVWLSWKNLSPLNTKRRWGLVSLRALSVALCLFLFFQPAVRLEDVTRLRNHLPVLVDVSQSMSLPGEEAGASRFQAAISLLEASSSRLERWRREHHLHFFQFAERIEPLPGGLESLNGITPQGGGTALLGAVEGVAARYRPEELAAVIILSDGDDRSGALPEAAREAPAKLGALGARLGAPIHTLFTGPETPPVDVSIESVRHDDFAFVRNPIKIETAIQLQGLTAARLPPLQVTFSKEGVVIGQRLLIPQSDEGRYLFEFEFTPEQTGEAIYEVSVEAAPGETILNNNKRLFPIRIIRDKIRALQVVGRPSWDERFLRKLLKRNPNIELISFFILRTNASVDATPSDELSLIPFPTQELFEEKLHTFDLLIFQNFTFRGYRMRQFLPLIQRYVERGGGFMML